MKNPSLLILSIGFIVGLSACDERTETTTPEFKDITESVYATGYIKSKNQYEVFGQMHGVIEEVFVSEGMQVKKGDPIFKMDNQNLQIATENALLASTASDYERNMDKLEQAEKAIVLAERNLRHDSTQFERQKRLWNQNIGSKVQFEQMELKYEQSQAELTRLKTEYNDLKRQLKLASDQSKNNLEIAKLQEEDFTVRSEVDGVVYKLNKGEGELNDGREPVAIIGAEEFIIELTIDEKDIVKINKGQEVVIRMDSYESQVFEARIIAVERMMNQRTRSFQAEAVFTATPPELYPNLTVEANIVIRTKENALTIPRTYLVNENQVQLKGGQLKEIGIGLMDYELVEVLSGIDENTTLELPAE